MNTRVINQSELENSKEVGIITDISDKELHLALGLSDPTCNNEISQQDQNESTHDTSNSTAPSEPQLFFQAVGLVRGQYLPSTEKLGSGILLLDDGVIAPTNLLASAVYTVKKHPNLLESPQVWIVYPRVQVKNPPFLNFAIRGARLPLEGEDAEVINQSVDDFSIRGIVTYTNRKAGNFVVKVYRNFMPWKEQEGTKYKPHIFTITGVLPSESLPCGQFWDLKVKRVADQLVLEDATFITQVFEPKKPKKGRSKRQGQKRKAKRNQSNPQ